MTKTRIQKSVRGSLFVCAATGLLSFLAFEPPSMAQTYICPPAPEGVYGLPGAPRFADNPAPDSFAQKVDDPRWNGNWREDFAASTSTEAGVRMLRDGNFLYISFEATVDPDGEAAGSDAVYLGFSKNGTTAEMVKIVMEAGPPLDYSNNISTVNWWRTTDGGATQWTAPGGPLGWAPTVRAWAGAGASNGDSWAMNAKVDLSQVLGGLANNFYMWFSIDIETGAGPIPYDWPPGALLSFPDGTHPMLQVKSGADVVWGNAYPTVATNCPTGISVDPMHIGTTPAGMSPPLPPGTIPDTTVHFGTGRGPNTFVALMDNGGLPIANNSVQARFRIANWGSQIGVGGTWQDIVPGTPPGTRNNVGNEIDFHCVNPPDMTDSECLQLVSPPAPADQCLLVELSRASGAVSGVKFLSDSARRNMDFVNASTFARSAEISVRGLAPLAGSDGTRDTYLYVRALNMPERADGNPPIAIPPPVPLPTPTPVRPGLKNNAIFRPPPLDAGMAADAGPSGNAGASADAGAPQYRMTTYQRYASAMPTYEVHVYHDTGRTRSDNGHTRKVLEPQAPFGYFVTHKGDLSGWQHELTGEGFVLEKIGPNFYHAKIPDNGAVRVRTKITANEHAIEVPDAGEGDAGAGGGSGGGCDHPCGCKVAGAKTGSRDGWLVALGVAVILLRRRRR